MPILIRTDPTTPDKKALLEAVAVLKGGGVVAYPTETFYGLGADASDEKAVERVYALKGREFNKPLPLIIGDREIVSRLVEEIPETARKLMDAFWPGGLTIVFKASPFIVPRLTGGTGKIGIRLSSNPIASKLSALLSRPLTATSANLSGEKECVSAREVSEFLGDLVDAVIDGGSTPGGKGSTIVDVTTDPPTVLRAGVIPPSLIRYRLEKNA
ncbi:MAG: threonylcarbamoyl-AMP synthase [Syntrophobacterales bacterium]|nr:threonylcarbamoyl-AMP synthase [Syntrophobacterales bacterium]